MVALKDYRPNNLNVNPFQIGTELAKPYDYDGVLSQIAKWDALNKQEASTEKEQIEAQKSQEAFDLDQKRKAAVEASIEAGQDPAKIDYSEISRSIGDFEGLVKAEQLKSKTAKEADDERIKRIKDFTTIGKTNPELSQQLANEFGIGNFRAPVQKGDKPKDPKPPKVQPWTNGSTLILVDENDAAAVNQARAQKLMPLKAMPDSIKQTIDPFGSGGEPEATPEVNQDPVGTVEKFLRGLNGDGNKAVNPGNSPTPPSPAPPGMKWQRSNLGNFKLVPR